MGRASVGCDEVSLVGARLVCNDVANDVVKAAAGVTWTLFTSTEDVWEGDGASEAGSGDKELKKLLVCSGVKIVHEELSSELGRSVIGRS